MKFSKSTLSRVRRRLYAADTRFYVFISFLVILLFSGGSSRDDVQSLVVLRPLAIIFCAYALTVKVSDQWVGRMFPIYILGALFGLFLFQLAPLPPLIWAELPGRKIFADIANTAGIEQPWRTLSLSPSKTLNSLFSLAIPAAAMMLYLNLERQDRNRVIPVIIILISISALWAIFQLAGPSQGPLYLYRITTFGTAVGLFANRNHQAVMLASTIVMLGWYAASLTPAAKWSALKFYGSAASILVLVPLILVTGSRAGLILMIPALIFTLFFLYFGRYGFDRRSPNKYAHSKGRRLFSSNRLLIFCGLLAVGGVSALSIFFSRSLAYDRLFGGSGFSELRVQVLPTLFNMAGEYLPWGSGFGSFEHVYKIYEPLALLSPSYLNQAHNDWIQFVTEGGVPAILIAMVAMFWLVVRLLQLLKNWHSSKFEKYRGLMCFAVILLFLAASIGDYPLRVPSIMAVFAVLVCVLNDSVRSVQRREIK